MESVGLKMIVSTFGISWDWSKLFIFSVSEQKKRDDKYNQGLTVD